MSLSTLVFDFDGTLANSFEATLRIANSLAPEFGFRAARPDELDDLRASSYREIAEKLGIAWHKIPLIVARMRTEMRRSVADLETFEGMPEVLAKLRQRGITLGILTSNDQENVEHFLRARGLSQFDFISSSASLWGKERRLKSLLKKRGLRANEVAYVGDEVRDIEAVRPLQVRMIAVSWGFSHHSLLAAHSPDHLLREPSELLDVPGLR